MSQVWVSFAFALGKTWVNLHLCCISGPAEVPVASSGERDFSTEAESKKQKSSRSNKRNRCLLTLAQSASTPIEFSIRERTRTLLEQAFDYGMYQLKKGYL